MLHAGYYPPLNRIKHKIMRMRFLLVLSVLISYSVFPQEKGFEAFLADSSMKHAAVSCKIIDADSGVTLFEFNPEKSLIPASVLKLVTTAASFELLGPDYTFKTAVGYSGSLNERSGLLKGNIIIKGGGDPALGSEEFEEHYADFVEKWADEIMKAGIRKIKGKIITDDSYYDYEPVPGKWLWEDAGNYYGAGAYGLSVYDNTYGIHFKTLSDSSGHIITGVMPEECRSELTDFLFVSGSEDEGYVFAAPYSSAGWLSGTIPSNQDDFILKASVTDPPLLMARIIDKKLRSRGIKISGNPSTYRLEAHSDKGFIPVCEVISPPFKEVITVLNHESVNLYAEHLLKELGKVIKKNGSTSSGTEVLTEFLNGAGIDTEGMFLEDGSGLSPLDAVNAQGMTDLLFYMKNKAKYFNDFFASLPEAGKEGTLKNYFRDPVFESSMSAKSGSMTRVRSYAGYLTTKSGNKLIFCIIVNNFTGPSSNIISHIEEILKEIILNK
jgi:D-alanyl-D-alanine carboxypeptidase/D-alanyl-D-alanine-endopeptidase (penicillin-binding protein 4)